MDSGITQPASAFVLVGPTAVGKSSVAHLIARRRGYGILSSDAMLVYRGMDIGTAKPSTEELAERPYAGVDLVSPNEDFNVGEYYRLAGQAWPELAKECKDIVVAGGTGLYVKALINGLDELPPANPALRKRAEDVLAAEGILGLQQLVKRAVPAGYEGLADKDNPRRLIRALEIGSTVEKRESNWSQLNVVPVIGLRMPSKRLHERIETRVHEMYETGLLVEVETLKAKYGQLSQTAAQAIGYAEALSVLDRTMSEDDARDRTMVRTRRLAKRQMTWFRHQLNVEWVDVDGVDAERVADQVEERWMKHGRTALSI